MCTEGNDVFAFGSNEYGELGLGHERPTVKPSLVSVKKEERLSFYRIACGRNHSAAVDGTLGYGIN